MANQYSEKQSKSLNTDENSRGSHTAVVATFMNFPLSAFLAVIMVR